MQVLTVHTVVVLAWRFSPLCWRGTCHHPCENGTEVWHLWIWASYHRLRRGSIQLKIHSERYDNTYFIHTQGLKVSLVEVFLKGSSPWWTMSWSMRCCMRHTAVARSEASLWLTSQSISSCARRQFGYVRKWYRRSLISFPSWSLNLEVMIKLAMCLKLHISPTLNHISFLIPELFSCNHDFCLMLSGHGLSPHATCSLHVCYLWTKE